MLAFLELGLAKNDPWILTILGCHGTPDPRNSYSGWGTPELAAGMLNRAFRQQCKIRERWSGFTIFKSRFLGRG